MKTLFASFALAAAIVPPAEMLAQEKPAAANSAAPVVPSTDKPLAVGETPATEAPQTVTSNTEGKAEDEKAPPMDLTILTSAPPHWGEKDFRLFIASAMKAAKCECNLQAMRVTPISRTAYQCLAEVIDQGRHREVARARNDMIEQDPERADYWKLVIPAGAEAQKISGITVRYLKNPDGKMEEETFTLEPAIKTDSRFRFYQPGLALFRTDEMWEPKQYALMRAEEKPQFQDWPAAPRQFFISIPEFTGGQPGRKELFKQMASGDLSETLINDSEDRPVTFAHADFSAEPIIIDPTIQVGNMLVFRFLPLSGTRYDPAAKQGVARVWMLFPLTEQQKDDVLKQLNEARMSRSELAELIRGGGTGFPVQTADMVDEGIREVENVPNQYPKPTVALGPAKKPTWYEIPAIVSANGVLQSYDRSFQIQDAAGWLSGDGAEKSNWRVFAYEYEEPAAEGTEPADPVTILKLFVYQNVTSVRAASQLQEFRKRLEEAQKAEK